MASCTAIFVGNRFLSTLENHYLSKILKKCAPTSPNIGGPQPNWGGGGPVSIPGSGRRGAAKIG
jgi:hypothetical protein